MVAFRSRAQRRRERLRISGGSDSQEEFRKGVRERLADGRLFLAYGVSTLRRGSGRLCNVCGKAIASVTQEHEVEGAGYLRAGASRLLPDMARGVETP